MGDPAEVLSKQAVEAAVEILAPTALDVIGLFGGDWVRSKRRENAAVLKDNAIKRLAARGVKADLENPCIAVIAPIVAAAADETRPELIDLWERLLAAALDPARIGRVRRSFIAALKDMDPTDALVFDCAATTEGPFQPHTRGFVASKLKLPETEVEVSLSNLISLGLLAPQQPFVASSIPTNVYVTSMGKLFHGVVRD